MKYLNLGCGKQYVVSSEWTNVDFVSSGDGVIAHNLLRGIPFENNQFDLVYHSHVLEHFSKADAEVFISECIRVLKPGGILRVVVPDLEKIAQNYLRFFTTGMENPQDATNRLNYEWTMLEMYDQTVRNASGGNMAAYLFQENIGNEAFVYDRIGAEGKAIREMYYKQRGDLKLQQDKTPAKPTLLAKLKYQVRLYLLKKLKVDERAMQIGKFRLGGEIHQWMYDRYSLGNILKNHGCASVQVTDAFSSAISGWNNYFLDGREGMIRKPDSLFMEATK